MARFHVAFAFFSLLLAADAVAEPADFDAAVSHLRSFTVNRNEETVVPPQVGEWQTAFRRDLRNKLLTMLPDLPAQQVDVPALQARFDTLQSGMAMPKDLAENDAPGAFYGYVRRVELARPAGHADLLALTATVSIACGDDTSLYLLRHTSHGWQLALDYSADGYGDIGGAYGDVQYALAPSGRDGGYYVVVGNVNPACWSNWQSLRYRIYRISPGQAPHSVLDDSHVIDRGVAEPIFELHAAAGHVDIDFIGEDPDPDVITRPYRLRYLLDGEQVRQVGGTHQPPAVRRRWAHR